MKKQRPAIFLDVDGVINDLQALDEYRFGMSKKDELPRGCVPLKTGAGYTVFIPSFMPSLLQHLHEVADIYWLTTWRERANRYISPAVGLPTDLPVITDGKNSGSTKWKWTEARPYWDALAPRPVYWIEDFYFDFKGAHAEKVPSHVTLIDTGNDLHLKPSLLPKSLLDGWADYTPSFKLWGRKNSLTS